MTAVTIIEQTIDTIVPISAAARETANTAIQKYQKAWLSHRITRRSSHGRERTSMTTANEVLAVARAELGYVEQGGPDGKSGNITKEWAELAPSFQGQAWCAAFVQWVYKHAGVPLISKSFYVATIVGDYRKAGRLFPIEQALPGDQVLYSFGQGHTGIVVSTDPKARTLIAIEGNTQQDSRGDQANGGGVYLRSRPWTQIYGVGRPPLAPANTSAGPPAAASKETVMPRSIIDRKALADGAGRRPNWEVDSVGNIYCWDGARQLKSLSAFTTNHPPIVDIDEDPSGDGLILFGGDGRLENGVWARSTYTILVGS